MPDLFTSLLILALSVGIAYLINWVPNVVIPNPYASMIKALSPEEAEAKVYMSYGVKCMKSVRL